MYINAGALEFGAWPLAAAGPTGVRFSLFFPNATQFVAGGKPAGYGDPQIDSIFVVGSFQTALGQPPGAEVATNRLTSGPHPSGKGTIWQVTTAALPEGFYDYHYLVHFSDGSTRPVTDPCARWGGTSPDRSGVVVGTSPIDAPVRPVAGGRKPYRDLVVYELNIDDFTAEIPGLDPPIEKTRQRIADLGTALGVNAIEFLPWTAWADDNFNWGYAPVAYFSVEHRYTDNPVAAEETIQRSRLKRLFSELHDAGVHVVMDGVFNHAGPGTATTAGFAYRHFYLDRANCPYIGTFGGRFPGLLDLDYHNACTQEFIQDVCFYWMDEFGIDGIRYDNAINMVESGSTRGIEDLTAAVAAHATALSAGEGPKFSQTIEYLDLGAATFTDRISASSYWRDSLYQDCFGGLWSGALPSRTMTSLDSKAYLTSPGKVATTYLSNHDHSCVAFQAGARDNQGSIAWYRMQPHAIAILLSPGTPLIPNGQEFASDHFIPEDDRGTSRRITPRPLHWSYRDDAIGTSLLSLYGRLIQLRKDHPCLRSDDIYPAAWPEGQGVFNPQGYGVDTGRQLVIFHRWGAAAAGGGVERFIIALNFSAQDQQVDIPFPTNGAWTDQLPNRTQVASVTNFWLRGWTVPSNYGCVFLQ